MPKSFQKYVDNQLLSQEVAKQRGFAVLTATVLLTMAAILFTLRMASSQLVDNQVIGNYYRNNEAFANAESGVNFVLSQLDDPQRAQSLLNSLPITYSSSESHYRVSVDKLTVNRLTITSDASSVDGSAMRQINLEVDFYLHFPIPSAAVSVNGKLNLSESASVNDGCEGLNPNDCLASGNVAEAMLVSNPSIELDGDEQCLGGNIGSNVIAENVLNGVSEEKIITQITTAEGATRYDWGQYSLPENSYLSEQALASDFKAQSLFEATFAMPMNSDNLERIWDNAVQIDNSDGGDCAEQFHLIDEDNEIIYIKGDCDISQYYTEQSKTSEANIFTIGSVAHPKLVFIEGGTFKTQPNTETFVVGMLYFLPDTHYLVDEQDNFVDHNGALLSNQAEAIQVPVASIDMGAVHVNGALLSEYRCSYDGIDNANANTSQQHFSARFDKLVLDKLYADLGVAPIASGYRLVAGSWRDF